MAHTLSTRHGVRPFASSTLAYALSAITGIAGMASAQFVEPEVVVIAPLSDPAALAGDNFGWGGSGLIDINADGANDVILGAPFNDSVGMDSGRAYVFSGRTGERLRLWEGEPSWRLGFSFADAGDVNADGTHDIIIGGVGLAPFPGMARVYSGADGSVLFTHFGAVANDQYGHAVTGLGDINGDGHSEYAVGAQLFDGAFINAGRVYVYSGIDHSLIRTFDGAAQGDLFGSGISDAGDLNHDGRHDLVVGARGNPAALRGNVRVFSVLDGAQIAPTMTPDPVTGRELGWFFVGGVGDLNGDGVDDIYAGDFGDSDMGVVGTGRAYVFSGSTGLEIRRFNAEAPGDGVGPGRGAGDVDRDGITDLIIASYTSSAGAPTGGRVRVFSGVDGHLIRTITGTRAGETLGFDAVGIGDVNNDCAVDFLITGSNLNTAYIIAGLPGPCVGDTDGDLIVGLGDIARIIAHWAETTGPTDLNCDSLVGLADIAIVLQRWGTMCSTTR